MESQTTAKTLRQAGLQGVIVGGSGAVHLQDVAEVWKFDTTRVDVGNDIQFPPLAADISDLELDGIAEALLNLKAEVVEVRSTEILADGIRAQALRIIRSGAIRIRARRQR